jgi:hypothetical protein
VRYVDARTVTVGGRTLRVPATGVMEDVRGADTLRVELTIDDATATDTRLGLVERGEVAYARGLARPYFVQMKGRRAGQRAHRRPADRRRGGGLLRDVPVATPGGSPPPAGGRSLQPGAHPAHAFRDPA